jgi:hypothetical protein
MRVEKWLYLQNAYFSFWFYNFLKVKSTVLDICYTEFAHISYFCDAYAGMQVVSVSEWVCVCVYKLPAPAAIWGYFQLNQ